MIPGPVILPISELKGPEGIKLLKDEG